MEHNNDDIIVGDDGLYRHMNALRDTTTGGGTITDCLLENECAHGSFFIDAHGRTWCAFCGKEITDVETERA